MPRVRAHALQGRRAEPKVPGRQDTEPMVLGEGPRRSDSMGWANMDSISRYGHRVASAAYLRFGLPVSTQPIIDFQIWRAREVLLIVGEK
jgi:hypothetical protein